MKKTFTLSVIILISYFLSAQEVKFGKVPDELLSQTAHPKFPDAPAAIIYKEQNVYFDYLQSTGWRVVTKTFVRLKIYTKNGLDYANFEVPLYKDDNDIEDLTKYKGYTFNLENGKVVENKLKSDGVFKNEMHDYLNMTTLTLPAVKEGSVIDLEYTVTSPFFFNINEFSFQQDIPVDYMTAEFQSPEYFLFKRHVKGYHPINFQEINSEKTFALAFRQGSDQRGSVLGSFNANRTTSFENVPVRMMGYKMKVENVPPLTDESYVNNIKNYTTSVKFELNATKSDGSYKTYTQTWEKVAETIYKSSSFGGELTKRGYYKDDLAAINAKSDDPMQRAAMIFTFLQNKMNWNGYTSVYARQNLPKAYNENTGNVAEINLILTAMLRDAGLNANPVLVSTREHGVSLFPTREGFNYVISAIETDNGYILLDASDKFCEPNLLPTRALNWSGILIREDHSIRRVSLTSPQPAQKAYMMMANLNPEGKIEGKMRITHSNHYAIEHRQKHLGENEEAYLAKLENQMSDMEISDYQVTNLKERGKPVMESFSFSLNDAVEQIGDKLYLNPLFFAAVTENPFKLDQRDYPVDFTYPQEHKFVFTLNLPEGYQVENIPENIALSLPNEYGNFKYQINQTGNALQILTNFNIHASVVPALEYPNLKAFFAQMVQKETEKVVLSKI